ncbi:MAG: hypothetical protein WA874_21505 [Chryseosolibacter sp.]
MFRQGKPRSVRHNLRLASILSFVAGIVNINGVLSMNILTTNVTGHFAFFSREFVEGSMFNCLRDSDDDVTAANKIECQYRR